MYTQYVYGLMAKGEKKREQVKFLDWLITKIGKLDGQSSDTPSRYKGHTIGHA